MTVTVVDEEAKLDPPSFLLSLVPFGPGVVGAGGTGPPAEPGR